jgi:primosomal replication protein N
VNRLVLAARLVERRALRYTPAGLPVQDFELKHDSELSENGQARKVSMQIRSVAIGQITQAVAAMELGSAGQFAGFLDSARNGRGLMFHVTALEPSSN